MQKYRVAVVGLGRMGSTLDISIAAACQVSDRLELVAGAETIPERRAAFTETWGVDSVYEHYVEMIEKESPDIVAVCTTATGLPKPGNRAPSRDFRSDSHAEVATAAAKAGVPMLYVEKAVACSMEAADGIRDACEKSGTIINTGVLMRFDTRFEFIRDAINRGDIGQPTHAVAYTASNTLMHMHIHSIDMLSYLLGDPGVVAARGELLPRGLVIEDNRLDEDPRATYHIRFENGVEAWSIPAGSRDFEIIGSEGTIRSMSQGRAAIFRKSDDRQDPQPHFLETMIPTSEAPMTTVVCLEDLIDAYENKHPPRGDLGIVHNITEACLAIGESHRLGGAWVDLPIDNRSLYIFHV